MCCAAKKKPKPLSFSTTMRNPNRIAGFLECLLPFENMILTSEIIHAIIKKVLSKKYYQTMYQKREPHYKNIFQDEDRFYSDSELEDIIMNSPQKHKEAGFNYGWDSRFDTWYKLPMEFGFVFYEMNMPIIISNTGHMLIDAYKENPVNETKIQNIFLNSMMKYQTSNPFRKNENDNVPLLLLLNVLYLLKTDPNENGAGVSRKELSLFICWRDNNAENLYKFIKKLRSKHGFNYSDEFMYEICLDLLDAKEQKNYIKMEKVCGESVDEYIRKMRSTGVISLRGNGRFVDLNMLEFKKISYILDNYTEYKHYDNKKDYFLYMGTIDTEILSIGQDFRIDTEKIKKATLQKYAKEYSKEKVKNEILKVCNKKESSDPMLKFINAPTRLEFLTSIALVQNFKGLDVNPNYAVDDEGLPTYTACGGVSDIECYDNDYNSFFEVTLMMGRQQVTNEIIPIRRHLIEYKEISKNCFSVFIAPKVHEDAKEAANWYKYRDNLDILTFDIDIFLKNIEKANKVSHLLHC